MSEFKRVLDNGSEVSSIALTDDSGRVVTVPQNITTKFREAFETYDPVNGGRWTQSLGSGDLVFVDGNAVGASYLVISKDPLTAGTETQVTTVMSLPMPIELALGLHLSQRTVGQEFSVELVSDDGTMAAAPDVVISNLSQATTTLTVNTATPHNLKPGMRIGIYGSPDSRANYPSLVVATIPTPNQFTVTAGPMGSIPSLTFGPVNGGSVYVRSSTGWAHNAVSMLFENAVTTNASFYVKTESSDVHPAGGTLTGNHSITVGSVASVQAINNAYTYAFQPTTEFKLALMTDRFQWSDVGVDSTGASTSRSLRSQITPDPTKKYKLRFRHTNNKGLTVPVAQIVSAAKTGTTTATITTDVAHGLTITDVVQLWGVRDQTNFANTGSVSVASILNSTQFTVVFGTAITGTSFGGTVARVQGGQTVQGLAAQVIQNATVTGGILTLNANLNWSGLLIGDLVNTLGVRDGTTGASLGLDGAWRVRNVSALALELEAVGNTPVPATLATTNCGGAVVRRTDARISYARVLEFKRDRVEMLARPINDQAASVPVVINNATVPAQQSTRGTAGSGWWVNPDNSMVTDVPSAALTVTGTTGTITPASPAGCAEFSVIVTAVSGTTPTLDIGIEESDDGGTNWIRIYDFPRITATGAYRTPLLLLNGNRVRYVQTVGGTTPSFTRSINRVPNLMMGAANNTRQVIDRTIDVNTQGSATAAVLVNGTGAANCAYYVNGGTYTTGPTLQLQGSYDGVAWFPYGTTLPLTTGQTGMVPVANAPFQFFRVYVQTAGTGGTIGQTTVTLRTY